MVSGPYSSASYCPNAALTCCSLVLTLALLQCISYKSPVFCVTFLVFGTLFEPKKLLKTGPDIARTHSLPCLVFTYVNTDYLKIWNEKDICPTMAFLRHDQDCWFILRIKFPFGDILCSFITYCFPSSQAVTTAMKTWIQKSSVGSSLIT